MQRRRNKPLGSKAAEQFISQNGRFETFVFLISSRSVSSLKPAYQRQSELTKRILHLTGMRSTKLGAMERYLLELAHVSAQMGYLTDFQYKEIPRCSEYLNRLCEVGARVIVEPIPRTTVGAFRALNAIFSHLRPDIVHTHFVPRKILPIVWASGKTYGVRRYIAMIHRESYATGALKNRIAFAGFDRVLAVSDAVGRSLRKSGVPTDILRTHYMGLIDPPKYSMNDRVRIRTELGIPEDAVVFGNIAFDSPIKGVDLLIEAFRKLSALRPDVRLLQIGVDRDNSALARSTAHLQNIHWIGIRDNACSYLSAVDIYVQPSRSEGLPLAILEAMSMERPIIAAAVGGIPEAVIDGVTGILVPPGCVKSLAREMMKFIDAGTAPYSLTAQQNMGINARRKLCEHFDGRSSVRKLVETCYL